MELHVVAYRHAVSATWRRSPHIEAVLNLPYDKGERRQDRRSGCEARTSMAPVPRHSSEKRRRQ
jgi:hypothetical protein